MAGNAIEGQGLKQSIGTQFCLSVKVLSILVVLGVVSGCASLMGLGEPPQISLTNIQPVAIGLLEQRYLITVRIQNPNAAPLRIEGLDYQIGVNGKAFADGVSSQHVTVPGYAEKTLDLGIRSTLLQLVDQFKGLAGNSGRLKYNIQGHLQLRDPTIRIPFEYQGDVDLHFKREPNKHSASSKGRFLFKTKQVL